MSCINETLVDETTKTYQKISEFGRMSIIM